MSSTLKSTAPLVFAAFASGALVATVLARRRNPPKTKKLSPEEHLWSIVSNSFTGALLHAGDALQLYDHLQAMGRPVTAKEFSKATGWSERWLLEFLSQAVGAGFCTFDPEKERFALKDEYAPLLCNPETNPRSMAGMLELMLPLVKRAETVVVPAIRTGKGVDYDFGNKQVIRAIDRKNFNWFRDYLVSDVLEDVQMPATGEPLTQVLERGVNVADMGCGCGASTIVMAKKYPQSTFYAYEASELSLQVLQQRVNEANLTNIVLCNVANRTVTDGANDGSKFTFAYCHDLLHDMSDPLSLMADVKKMLSPDGCWIVVDIKCSNSKENILSPAAATMFGFSCLLCLASSTSEENGLGLGTCGLPTSKCRQFMLDAGFTYFEEKGVKSNPVNSRFLIA